MKIEKVVYVDGEVRFRIEGLDFTYCIELKEGDTAQSIKDQVKANLLKDDSAEQIFNDLNLKGLEGADL